MLFHVAIFGKQAVNWDISFSQSVLEEAANGTIDDHDKNSKIIKW